MRKELFFMFFLLTGCSGGVDEYYNDEVRPFLKEIEKDYKPQVFEGVMEPVEFPNLKEDQKTLLGIDSNNDGVRDDLEIYINRKLKYDYERETLKKYVRHAQVYLSRADQLTKAELKKEIDQFSADKGCRRYYMQYLSLNSSNDELNIFIYVGRIVFNTKERKIKDRLMDNALENGDFYGSGISSYKEAFYECSDYVKKKYPYNEK